MAMNVYSLTNDKFEDFEDFNCAHVDEKKAFTRDFLTDAKAFYRDCEAFLGRLEKQFYLSMLGMVTVLVLQLFEVVPMWVPGWYFALLFHGEAWVRLPQVSVYTSDIFRSAKVISATKADYSLSMGLLDLMFVVWLIGGFWTDNWGLFSVGTTIFTLFAYSYAIHEFKKVVHKNRNAYKAFGEQLVASVKKESAAL